MNNLRARPKVGVMGSAGKGANEADSTLLTSLAERLGQVIAERGCVLVTGATTGFPDIVSRSARRHGGVSIGISPASSRVEHVSQYALPDDGVDLIVYTGFGLKGRNVVNVRTSDVVIIFGGGIGTLNEFTIAYDEEKLVGVLEGTGGVADRIKEIIALSNKQSRWELVFESSPEALIDNCLRVLRRSS
ncbi:MAG: hypothetical protein AABN34_17615 [Acidobacteriota bacterium]